MNGAVRRVQNTNPVTARASSATREIFPDHGLRTSHHPASSRFENQRE